MSTLAVVEQILRETEEPMSVRQIVEYADGSLPTRSRTPDTVVARDLSMDIKKKGEASLFIRTSPGRYTIRAIHLRKLAESEGTAANAPVAAQSATDTRPAADARPTNSTTPMVSSVMRGERAGTLAARSATDSDGDYATSNHTR